MKSSFHFFPHQLMLNYEEEGDLSLDHNIKINLTFIFWYWNQTHDFALAR